MNDLSAQVARIIHEDPTATLALEIIARLRAAGYVAFLAGGCVRDALVGRPPKDYDVATNAHPDEVRKLFGYRQTLAVGAAFGVICVLSKRSGKTEQVEVATFRSDGPYTDGRRPDTVRYSSPEEDAARRDFTINGLFYDPQSNSIIDFVSGCQDLRCNQLRAIGDPHERFREDKLRLLRAIRFATTYNFEIEEVTWEAIRKHASEVTVCSGERIGGELQRLLTDPNVAHGLTLLVEGNLANAIFPTSLARALTPTTLSVTATRMKQVAKHDFASRLAILLLCTLEKQRDSNTSWIPPELHEILADLTERWRLSNEQRDAASTALTALPTLLAADTAPWSALQPLLIHRYRDTSVAVARALLATDAPNIDAAERIEAALKLPAEILDPPPLLKGEHLIAAGYRPNPRFKSILSLAREMQLDGKISTLEEALSLATK